MWGWQLGRTDGWRDGAKVQSGGRQYIHTVPPLICAAMHHMYGIEKVRCVT